MNYQKEFKKRKRKAIKEALIKLAQLIVRASIEPFPMKAALLGQVAAAHNHINRVISEPFKKRKGRLVLPV